MTIRRYDDHIGENVRPKVMGAFNSGQIVALVSDAGTPLVSDPGYRLAVDAIAAGFRVHPSPGPSSALAALTLAGDAFKGWLAVTLAASIAPTADLGAVAVPAAGLAAFLGHLFPLFLGFKGGKGVATYIGVLLGLFWPAALAFCAIWIAVAVIFRYSSLAALVASVLVPVMLFWSQHTALAAVFALMTVALWIMHRANIQRLMNGTEGKIGKKG